MKDALHVVAIVLGGAAALLTFTCAIGVAVMRDPYQRLHYVAPPSTLGAFLVAAGAFAETADPTAGLKSLVIVMLLGAQAGVLAHATARAIFVRQNGGWPPRSTIPGASPGAGGTPP